MMKSKCYILALIGISLTLNACFNMDDDMSSTGDEYMTATINGTSYTGINVIGSISTGGLTFDEALIIGSTSGTQNLAISFYGPSNLGISEQVYENGFHGTGGCDTENEVCVLLQTGSPLAGTHLGDESLTSITVTSVNYTAGGFIEGTFSGKMENDSTLVVEVLNGEFRALIDE